MDLIATAAFTYAGQRLSPGDPLRARSPRDARILTAIGRARVAEPVEEPAGAPLAAGLVEATLAVELVEAPKPRRQYRRRDMTAES